MSLFTVLPVPTSTHRVLDTPAARRALRWFPLLGAALGAVAALVVLLVNQLRPGVPGRLLGALVAVAVIALVTGGMHLDGLADTVDGMASRQPPSQTLAVMDRSDIGPAGAAAVFFTVAVQVVSLAAIPAPRLAAVAVVLACVTARTAVLTATGPKVPSARPGGFGALVAGGSGPGVQVLFVSILVCAAAAATLVIAGPSMVPAMVVSCLLGLLVADQVRRRVQRVIGGITGDVLGALVEVAAATVLLGAAVLT